LSARGRTWGRTWGRTRKRHEKIRGNDELFITVIAALQQYIHVKVYFTY
jgi:hypothetical protein